VAARARNHQERTAVSRRGKAGGIWTGEPEDLSQGTDKRDLAAAAISSTPAASSMRCHLSHFVHQRSLVAAVSIFLWHRAGALPDWAIWGSSLQAYGILGEPQRR
jgi:hypothetical protein